MAFVPLRPTEEAINYMSRVENTTLDDLTRKCVHAIIVLGQNRNPIKKMDINKLAFADLTNFRITSSVLQYANKELNKTFGMRLYELEDKTRYLLVNSKPGFAELSNHSDDMCEELTVLYFILMDIFISPEEKISEDDIERSLKPLNMPKETIKNHLDSFIKRLYLVAEKGQDVRFFLWGPRAMAEVDPDQFFERFCELANTTSDKDWPDLKKRIAKLKSIQGR